MLLLGAKSHFFSRPGGCAPDDPTGLQTQETSWHRSDMLTFWGGNIGKLEAFEAQGKASEARSKESKDGRNLRFQRSFLWFSMVPWCMWHFCILGLDEDIYFLHPIAKPNDFDAKMQSLLISAHFNPGPGAEGAEEPATSSPVSSVWVSELSLGMMLQGHVLHTQKKNPSKCPM